MPWAPTTAGASRPQLASLTDTTAADFGAGTTGADTYVSETGERRGHPGADRGRGVLGRSGLPSGWESSTWESEGGGAGGSATVSDGRLVVDGASAGTVQTYGSGRALEFNATFGGANFEHVGFGVDFNNDPDWAMFSIKGDGTFNARTNNGGSQTETQLSSSLLGAAHHFRIEWAPTEVRYFVDGSLGRDPRGRFRHHRDATPGERLQQRRRRRLARLAAPEPLFRPPAPSTRVCLTPASPLTGMRCRGPPTRPPARAWR